MFFEFIFFALPFDKISDDMPYTAKTQYRDFETNIPKERNCTASQSQFPHSCVCERFIYSHDWSAYFAAGKSVDRSWELVNRSQTHECGNWDWGPAQFLFWESINGIPLQCIRKHSSAFIMNVFHEGLSPFFWKILYTPEYVILDDFNFTRGTLYPG